MKQEIKKPMTKSEKIYSAYKAKETLMTNYQICKAFFHDQTCSLMCLIEKILTERYRYPWQKKLIRKATMDARGKSNAVISIPQIKFEDNTSNILSKYVRKNFDIILADRRQNREYPFILRDIIDKIS